MTKTNAPAVFAEYWLTLSSTSENIRGFSYGYPPHELKPNQLPISKEEFYFLKDLNHRSLNDAKRLIRSIERKINRSKK